jgi:hypothetical protein
VLEVNFPLQKDDGTIEIITGYRAQGSILQNSDENFSQILDKYPHKNNGYEFICGLWIIGSIIL